uniref:Complex I-75kD n=1 Tax=Amicula sp. isolate GU52X-4 cfCalB7 TaxID=3003489 RepID=A0A9E9C267_9STRA|nr:NADH dehydrogenase subunit 11 part a [Amicula sp. isolate GU52X-4 cfCalB7]
MKNLEKKINNKVSLLAYLIAKEISLPHYCYHNNLSIAGNCRVCLIELRNVPKPLVACATNANIAMYSSNIFHDSVLVRKARENILEFLLINHPLDCPVCDQGGDCDLQDQSLYFGFIKRRFYKYKRNVSDKNLGCIVKTVMTRCIHCTRCVRFIREFGGVEELGIFGRGVDSEVGTYMTKSLLSELSGNVIDLCPVGGTLYKKARVGKRSKASVHKNRFFVLFVAFGFGLCLLCRMVVN